MISIWPHKISFSTTWPILVSTFILKTTTFSNLFAGREEPFENSIAKVENSNERFVQEQRKNFISSDETVTKFTPNEFESDMKRQIWLSHIAALSMLRQRKPKRVASQQRKGISVESVLHAKTLFVTLHETGASSSDQPYDTPATSKNVETVLQKYPLYLLFSMQSP